MHSLQNNVIVLTGAGSGIGRALALQLAARGARLALSDIDAAALQETAALLPPRCEARLYTLDVSRRDAVFGHAEQVRSDFGCVDVVINNAGVTVIGTVEHLTIEEIEWQLGINLWGVIYGTKAFLPMMLEQRRGCIVNISSIFGLIAYPGQSAYNISKFGVRALTECLWAELEGTGVRALSVHPGGIRTAIGKTARLCAAANEVERKLAADSYEVLLTTPPEDCAAAIVKGIERGKRRVRVGNRSFVAWWLPRLFPDSYPAIVRRLTTR
jgi:NAD(P)-dependent dehydrogenase (short-subunit alcohol dehydrogenase family)